MGLLSFLFGNKKVEKDVEELKNSMESFKDDIKNFAFSLAKMNEKIVELNEKFDDEIEQIYERISEIEEKISILAKSTRVGVEAKKELKEVREQLSKLIQKKKEIKREKPVQEINTEETSKVQEIHASVKEEMRMLSPAEREILSALLSSEIPLSYEEIAQLTGKSTSTVRDHMNNIRKKTNLLEVVETPDRKKLFRIAVKAKQEIIL